MRTLHIFFWLSVGAALCMSAVMGILLAVVYHHPIDFSALEQYAANNPSLLLDDQGKEWARFQLDRRDPVTIDQIPPQVIHAFLAAEDWQFFNHWGISLKGITRSLLVNVYHGARVQGASTITQQLVKLLFYDSRKTFERKIKEQCLALVVERQFSKEQILEAYLNHVYFGCGIYGVQAACQSFWGKNVQDISIDQAAVLAGIVRLPGQYCPLLCPLSSKNRRDVVLNSMHRLQFINDAQYAAAKAQELNLKQKKQDSLAPHAKEMIRQFIEDRFGGHVVYNGGLRIATTLNVKMQRAAQRSFAANHKKIEQDIKLAVDGALISIETATGQIKALVGGADFTTSKFNRATQARRQIGSTIKPLVFASAAMDGRSFDEVEIDEEVAIEQSGTVWRPQNFNQKFVGQMTLAHALSTSNNIVTIKTFLKTKPAVVVDLAKKAGLKGPFHQYPSLALGTIDATLVEVAGMFNIFANAGVYVEPYCIKWIKDDLGRKIYKKEPESRRVISFEVCSKVTKVLGLGLQRIGRMMNKKLLDAQAISKTGTTNDFRTCWFAGSTPTLTTAVVIGCDDNKSMGHNVYPIRTAFPIWLDMMRALTFNDAQFSFDPTLTEKTVDPMTGQPLGKKQNEAGITLFV